LKDLPVGVDHCGERGEFHTFCYRCPEFSTVISVQNAEIVHRDGFWFADLQRNSQSSIPPRTPRRS
jgi:diphthamide synthase (EF-2-diphthine--ammonia ligase)